MDGPRRWFGLRVEPLAELGDWLAPYRWMWESHVDRLGALLDTMPDDEGDTHVRYWQRGPPRVSDLAESLRTVAHPARRAMLAAVFETARSATELADPAGLSKSAVSQHLNLLRDAGLLHVRVDANRRLYRADPDRAVRCARWPGLSDCSQRRMVNPGVDRGHGRRGRCAASPSSCSRLSPIVAGGYPSRGHGGS